MVAAKGQPGAAHAAGCKSVAAPELGAAGHSALAWVRGSHWCWPQRGGAAHVTGSCCCCS